jgi:hypothetical protein
VRIRRCLLLLLHPHCFTAPLAGPPRSPFLGGLVTAATDGARYEGRSTRCGRCGSTRASPRRSRWQRGSRRPGGPGPKRGPHTTSRLRPNSTTDSERQRQPQLSGLRLANVQQPLQLADRTATFLVAPSVLGIRAHTPLQCMQSLLFAVRYRLCQPNEI